MPNLNITIGVIAKITIGILQQGNNSTIIHRISLDSRTMSEGDCFIAICGEQHDGHNFIPEVCAKKASCIIIERAIDFDVPNDIAIIKVESTIWALEKIAEIYSQNFSVVKIGITGSMGKTTTKEITASLLERNFSVLKTPKSYNNNIGIPLTLMELDTCHQIAVLEMGASHIEEIRRLSTLVCPNVAVITCIAPCHLEGFGSIENVVTAKAEILDGLQENGIFITNADDPACCEIAQKYAGNVVTFGVNAGDIRATNIHNTSDVVSWEINGYTFQANIHGKHNIYNILAGCTIACVCGMNFPEIQEAITHITLPPMRLEIHRVGDITYINDAYNANPKSMVSALEYLEEYQAKRKIAVLGTMRELGEESIHWHRWVGEQIPGKADIAFVLGEEAQEMAIAARSQGMENVFHYTEPDILLDSIADILQPGDAILFKASRRLQLERIYENISK